MSKNLSVAAQDYEPRRRRKEERNTKKKKDPNNHHSSFDYSNMGPLSQVNFYKTSPKHLWEGFTNTLVVSGSATAIGFASLVGMPLVALFSTSALQQQQQEAQNADTTTNRLTRLLVGGVMGSVGAGVSWTFAAVFGIWQGVAGLVRTPTSLLAQIQGKQYYNTTEDIWQTYNLTEHYHLLSESGGGRLRAVGVQDDSFYKLLRVSTDATSKEIKRAYYKLAKEYHPDKATHDQDKEAVNERFLKLHKAYETLHDPQQRRQYDEYGNAYSQDELPFDPDIFFDVLFGISPELEPYIGDLAIKSFTSNVVHLVLAAQKQQSDATLDQAEILDQLFSTFFLKTQDRRDMRQLEIAIHLDEIIAPYVREDMDWDTFSLKCAQEATKLMESTQFPIFVKAIGKSLYWQGRRTATSLMDLPVASLAWTRQGVMGLKKWTWLPVSVAKLIRHTNQHVTQANTWLEAEQEQQKNRHKTEQEWKSLHLQKVAEGLLPSIMDFVWQYNVRDITDAVDGSCWKLLHTSTVASRKERKRQARALEELGSSFLRVAQAQEYQEIRTCANHEDESCLLDEEKENKSFDYDTRIKNAMEMAMKSST